MRNTIILLMLAFLSMTASAYNFNANNVVITCVNGAASAVNTVSNIVIVCPPAASINVTKTPSSAIQIVSQTPIPNVTATFTVNAIPPSPPIPRITQTIVAGQANVLVNNVTIVAPSRCSISGSVSPSFTNTVRIINTTGSCNVNETVNALLPATIKQTVTASLTNTIYISNAIIGYNFTILPVNSFNTIVALGINQSYQFHGLSVSSPSYATFLKDTVQVPFYNTFVNPSTCSNIDSITTNSVNGTPISLCIQPRNQTQPTIFSACASYNLKFNLTPSGLYNCFLNMTQSFNASASYWKRQAIGINGSGGYKGLAFLEQRNASFWFKNDERDVGLGTAFLYVLGFLAILLVIAFLVMFWLYSRIQNMPPLQEAEPAKPEMPGRT